ncbi:S-layer homology domain-containing protein [Paenibacillus marinisediminis]
MEWKRFKRMISMVLVGVLIGSLLGPVGAVRAEEQIELSELIQQQEQDQAIEQVEPQVQAEAGTNSKSQGPASIDLGALEGYTAGGTQFAIYDQQSVIAPQYRDGTDLSSVVVDTYGTYDVLRQTMYSQQSDPYGNVVFLDVKELKGWELANLTEWKTEDQSNFKLTLADEVRNQGGDVYYQYLDKSGQAKYIMNTQYYNNNSVSAVLTPLPELKATWIKQLDGPLFLSEQINMKGNPIIDFSKGRANAVKLKINDKTSIQIASNEVYRHSNSNTDSMSLFVSDHNRPTNNEILVTKGSYHVVLNDQTIGAGNKSYFAKWESRGFHIQNDMHFEKIVPDKLQVQTTLNLGTPYSFIKPDITYGSFNLTYFEHSGDGSPFKVELIQKGKVVHSWNSGFLPLIQLDVNAYLESGDYTLKYTFNYPGAEPISTEYSFTSTHPDKVLNGYLITAEDRAGNKLSNGEVAIYQNTSNYDYDDYEPSYRLLYRTTIDNGEAFIPNAYLMNGQTYIVKVSGTDADKTPILYIKKMIVQKDSDMHFDSEQLRQIQIEVDAALQVNWSSYVDITFISDDVYLPLKEGKSNILLATNIPVKVAATGVDKLNAEGYALYKRIEPNYEGTIKLHQDNAVITLPQVWKPDQPKFSIHRYPPYYEAESLHVIQQKEKLMTSWSLKKNGYIYQFEQYITPDTATIELPFDKSFIGNAVTVIEGFAFITYENSQSNLRLHDIAHEAGTTTTQYTYQLYELEGKPIGQPIVTNQLDEFPLPDGLQPGKYRLKLLSTNLPAGVVDLVMDTDFLVSRLVHEKTKIDKKLPIELPKQITDSYMMPVQAHLTEWEEVSEGQYRDGDRYYLIPAEGQLWISALINPKGTYVLSLLANDLDSEAYVRQLILSGEELLQLDKIPLSEHQGNIQVVDDAPTGTGRISITTFDTHSMLHGQEYFVNRFDPNKSLTIYGDVGSVLLQNRNINSEGEAIYLSQKIDGATGDVSVSMKDWVAAAVPITINASVASSPYVSRVEFKNADQVQPLFDSNLYQVANQSINKILVTPGQYDIYMETFDLKANETPWIQTWKKEDVEVKAPMSLINTARLDKKKLSNVSYKSYGNVATITGDVQLNSGDWSLVRVIAAQEHQMFTINSNQVQRPYDGQFTNGKVVGPTVYVKNEAGTTLRATTTNDGLNLKSYQHSIDPLEPGNYKLEWNLPIGPLESIVLIESFRVTKEGESGGGENPETPGGGGGGFGIPNIPSNATTQKVDADAMKQSADGTLSVDVSGAGITEVVLSKDAVKKAADKGFTLNAAFGSVKLDAAMLAEWQAVDKDGELILRFTYPAASDAQNAALAYGKKQYADVTAASVLVGIHLINKPAKGEEHKIEKFKAGITLSMKLPETADPRLTSWYAWKEDGSLSYIGGQVKDGSLTAKVYEAGTYAAYTYLKKYDDIQANHWAADVIAELSAKRLINGVSEQRFEPARDITRAEFVSLLVRLLGLTSVEGGGFTDVDASAWYADSVNAAVASGLVQGVSSDKFEPNRAVSRAEMAVMLTRVAKMLEGTEAKLSGGESHAFADQASIPAWAQSAVQDAAALGLMKGRNGGVFAPLSSATRAEAAQVIYHLMQLQGK